MVGLACPHLRAASLSLSSWIRRLVYSHTAHKWYFGGTTYLEQTRFLRGFPGGLAAHSHGYPTVRSDLGRRVGSHTKQWVGNSSTPPEAGVKILAGLRGLPKTKQPQMLSRPTEAMRGAARGSAPLML